MRAFLLKMNLKHLPNILTISRLILIPFFLVLIYKQEFTGAFYLFMIAGVTDGLDGWLARKFNWRSTFGSFIDPLSDKLLIASSFISLVYINSIPLWLVVLVFMRDISISFGVLAWYCFIKQPIDFKPTLISKLNTFFQISLVILCLWELAFFTKYPTLQANLILLTTITTSVSFIDYVWTWGRKAFPMKQSI